jgi:hypothetical protein
MIYIVPRFVRLLTYGGVFQRQMNTSRVCVLGNHIAGLNLSYSPSMGNL